MSKYQYRIYPSALNSFQRLLDSDVDAEDFSNIESESGDYRHSPDEIYAEREQNLLDLINRVPKEPIEVADRGTAFNEIVDCIVLNKPCTRNDMRIEQSDIVPMVKRMGITDDMGKPEFVDEIEYDVKIPNICAQINGFVFRYDTEMCKETAKYMADSIPQHLCQGELQTKYGLVQLYGYSDYIFPDKVVDLKTCSRYDFGKYQRNWQKELYPYCLIQSGDMQECNMFEFYVVQMKNPTKECPAITGSIYREEYNYNHAEASVRLRQFTERFIEWLEAHRSQITNEKIFGGE